MKNSSIHSLLTLAIASVWFINGLFCKVLGLTHRHHQIVGELLGEEHSSLFTLLIGISEVLLAGWIVARYRPKISATLQIVLVVTMNLIEFAFVPELLLWGRFNLLFALLFSGLIYYNDFVLRPQTRPQP